MKLGIPPETYQPRSEAIRNRQIEQGDAENHKRGRDIEVGAARVILTSPNGSRWAITVNDLGELGTEAV